MNNMLMYKDISLYVLRHSWKSYANLTRVNKNVHLLTKSPFFWLEVQKVWITRFLNELGDIPIMVKNYLANEWTLQNEKFPMYARIAWFFLETSYHKSDDVTYVTPLGTLLYWNIRCDVNGDFKVYFEDKGEQISHLVCDSKMSRFVYLFLRFSFTLV